MPLPPVTPSPKESLEDAYALRDIDAICHDADKRGILFNQDRRHYIEKLHDILTRERIGSVKGTAGHYRSKTALAFTTATVGLNCLQILFTASPGTATNLMPDTLKQYFVLDNKSSPEQLQRLGEMGIKIIQFSQQLSDGHKQANIFELQAMTEDARSHKEHLAQDIQKNDDVQSAQEAERRRQTASEQRMQMTR